MIYTSLILSNLPVIVFLIYLKLRNYDLLVGLIFTSILVKFVKISTNFLDPKSILYKITRRPEKDLRCGFCFEQKTTLDDPGFPSGHSAFITYFALSLPNTTLMFPIKLVLILSTALHRVSIRCHTHQQVFFGTLFGIIMKIVLNYTYNVC